MSDRKHIPPRDLDTFATFSFDRAVEATFVPHGYRPVLVTVCEDAPDVDYRPEYTDVHGHTCRIVGPPVRCKGEWRVPCVSEHGNGFFSLIDHLVEIDPDTPITEVLDVMRQKIRRLPTGEDRDEVLAGLARLRAHILEAPDAR